MQNRPVQPTIRVEVERLNEATVEAKTPPHQGPPEVARSASEETVHWFVEYMPVPVAMLDREMQYLAASRQWRNDYHLETIDLSDRSFF